LQQADCSDIFIAAMKHQPTLLVAGKLTAVSAVCLGSLMPAMGAEPFEPTWDSLSRYECPGWFQDAKFGIYAHWGPYSASMGSRNTDWYSRHMYVEGHQNRVEHEKNHGPLSESGYKDLIPQFTAEKFDADEWAELYVEAGAKFAGPVGEHADGFAMWDSKVTKWNAAKMGPKRDIVAEMEKAIRKRGLKFMVSMHHHWKYGWYPTWDESMDCAKPEYAGLYGEKVPPTAWGTPGISHRYSPKPNPSKAFCDEWLGKVKEVVDGYQPDLLWFDNRMQILPERYRCEMASHYYNRASDLERARMPDLFPEPWLTDSSMSAGSWSFAVDMDLYQVNRMVDDLVDIVSKNGCMLLNIAPHPDGTIPEEQKERLRGIGRWLKLNGNAIYGSRPWLIFGEGPTVTPVGHLADQKFDGFGPEDIRFTLQGETLHAIALDWPKSGKLLMKELAQRRIRETIKEVKLLGHDGKLEWTQAFDALEITLPEKKPCEHAFVFRVER
jgi:alpha-L-fucosidase